MCLGASSPSTAATASALPPKWSPERNRKARSTGAPPSAARASRAASRAASAASVESDNPAPTRRVSVSGLMAGVYVAAAGGLARGSEWAREDGDDRAADHRVGPLVSRGLRGPAVGRLPRLQGRAEQGLRLGRGARGVRRRDGQADRRGA